MSRRTVRNTPVPIPAFQLFDPLKRGLLWVYADEIVPSAPAAPRPKPVRGPLYDIEEVDVRPIYKRLQALKAAIDDIDAQALRLVRLQARRREICRHGNRRGLAPRIDPCRPGAPPGWRQHRRRYPRRGEAEAILDDCHRLARHMLRPPDTS